MDPSQTKPNTKSQTNLLEKKKGITISAGKRFIKMVSTTINAKMASATCKYVFL
jgi:hypothetical protein